MSATLWHGSVTARRWSMPCPKCGRAGASTDTDALGQSVVRCSSCGPFLLPRTIGGAGLDWPIDLATLPADDGQPITPGEMARQCATPSCFRRVGPRSRHCGRCAALAALRTHRCAEPGCSVQVGLRADRCPPHARAHARANNAARARQIRRHRNI